MLALKLPSNEAEFEEMMCVVDRYLRESDVPPHERPIRGWLEVSNSLQLGLRMFPAEDRDLLLGVYTGDDMTIRIFRWFDQQYGDRLNENFGPGRIFLLLRRDPWVLRLPRIYGSAHIFASATEQSSRPEEYLHQRQLPRLNVVELIEGLTKSRRVTLESHELSHIHTCFVLGFEAMTSLEAIARLPMVRETQSDIEAAVQHVMNQPPHFGQSKWCSLQATEKVLKVFLESKTKSFPKHHELRGLAGLAEKANLPKLDHLWLDEIQCSAGIRYGEEHATLNEAFTAHLACLRVCRHVARAVQSVA